MVRNASWALVLVVTLGTASAAEVEIRRREKDGWALSRDAAREAESRERLRITPRLVDDRIDGFVVQDLDDAPTLASLGFEAGDVIRAVDGRRLDSAEIVLAIRAELLDRPTPFEVSVELERGGLSLTRSIRVS